MLSLLVVLIMWPRRRMRGAMTFLILMLAFAEWNFCLAFEYASVTRELDILWSKIAYFGTVSAPVLFLIFSLQYTDDSKGISPRLMAILWLIPLITLGMAFTNEYHGLLWSAVLPNPEKYPVRFLYYHGIWFWIAIIYFYLCLVIGTVLLIFDAIRQQHIYRQQAIAILIGIPLPWVANILYISGNSPIPGVDLSPFFFAVTGLVLALGIYRFQLFNLLPIARNRIIEELLDGLIVLDPRGRIVDMNPMASKMLAGDEQTSIGKLFQDVFPDLIRYIDQPADQAEIILKNHAQSWLELRSSSIYDSSGLLAGRILLFRDISGRKKAEEEIQAKSRELEKLAITDVLTGLNNRRYANQVFELELERSKQNGLPLSIGLLDIDRFKKINDKYGHHVGDEVLKEIANILFSSTRYMDMVARMGGDEFFLLFKNADLKAATNAMERLRQRVGSKKFPSMPEAITFSAGVILCHKDETADEAMHRVDKMLYQAKRSGRNRVLSDRS